MIIEYQADLVKDYHVAGAVKKSFKFLLDRKSDKAFPETYYGNIFAIKVPNIDSKYNITATTLVDDVHEGNAKIEIQLRNYVGPSDKGHGTFGSDSSKLRAGQQH